LDDLTDDWKGKNSIVLYVDPAIAPDVAAGLIFSSGTNASGAIDQNNMLYDTQGGFGDTSPFKPEAISRPTGIGYRLTQHYSVQNNVLGTYTIDRKDIAGAITVNKNGP
jgi:hypothetical protein